ncbi:MAG: hypothetical protein ACRD2C_24970 [Acidimicrobiales bacterium]
MSARAAPHRARGDRGSALMLMPACVLVVLVLASIAVDMALVHLRQRQAFDVAASAANDAVTAGVDAGRLRQGDYALDPVQVDQVVRRSVAASQLAGRLARQPDVEIEGDTVEVVLAVEADYLFSGAVPGAPDRTVVTAVASATAISP